MPYSVQADVQEAAGGLKRLKQLFDFDADGNIDVTSLTRAITEADAMIDGYAAKRFTVPFAPVPTIIKLKSAKLAVLIAARDRGVMSEAERDQWEEITSSDEKKPGWLLQLATGIVTPGGDPLPAGHSTMQNDSVSTEMPADRDVSRDKLGGFW